jgi:hypothetical protein
MVVCPHEYAILRSIDPQAHRPVGCNKREKIEKEKSKLRQRDADKTKAS